MAGGQKIDDHSFWAGKGSKGSVFPEGAKVRQTSSEEGAASVMNYGDTDSAIKHQQSQNKSQYKKAPMKDGYRN